MKTKHVLIYAVFSAVCLMSQQSIAGSWDADGRSKRRRGAAAREGLERKEEPDWEIDL